MLKDIKYLVMDIETTGLHAENGDIPTQFAGYLVMNSEILWSGDFLIKGGVPISEEASKITGITDDMLNENGIPLEQSLNMIEELIKQSDIIVCHNTKFDLNFLALWDERFEQLLPKKKTICTLTAAVGRMRYAPFKLGVVCKRLGIEVDETKLHDAMYDIELTYAFLRVLFSEGWFFRYNTICMPSWAYGNYKAQVKSKWLKKQKLHLKKWPKVSDEDYAELKGDE